MSARRGLDPGQGHAKLGRVTTYKARFQRGVILSDAGERYVFFRADVLGRVPLVGARVKFATRELRRRWGLPVALAVRPEPDGGTLPPLVIRRLEVAKARAVYAALHPNPELELRELERRPALIYLAVGADLGGDE